VKSNLRLTPEVGRTFVEQVIFLTLARSEHLATEKNRLSHTSANLFKTHAIYVGKIL
jgi:hypothetical protein